MLQTSKDERYRNPVTIQRDQGFLDLVDQAVLHNYTDRDFDLTALSSQLALSKRQVQRRLKTLVGHTPSEYLRSYRLRKSLEFLQKGLPVGQVAKAVGFSSQAYFASCFKAEFDRTPSDYQRRKS
ncbi:MAG: helix-turn-helix transcriptional regulator [Xanthomonadales bacterium]|nr:helix-turn-helix transcriptional regulator [Xanthomonadales bacterium]